MESQLINDLIQEARKPEDDQEHKGFKISYLREVFDAICSKDHWKDEWTAFVPYDMVAAVIVAVEFFHADKAQMGGARILDGKILMFGAGYQAW